MEFEKLQAIIADVLSIDPSEISMETSFVDDLDADSLDLAQVVMGLEDEFGIEIDAESNPATVGEFVSMVESLLEN